MGDDWQPGDLALCVFSTSGGHTGKIFTVRETYVGHYRGGTVLGLRFDDFPDPDDGGAWLASAFRKIHPHAPDAEDAETIRLLNSAPVREPIA